MTENLTLYAPFKVRFVNSYEEYDKPLVIEFQSDDPHSVDTAIMGLSSFYAGDPIAVFINGHEIQLDLNDYLTKWSFDDQA